MKMRGVFYFTDVSSIIKFKQHPAQKINFKFPVTEFGWAALLVLLKKQALDVKKSLLMRYS